MRVLLIEDDPTTSHSIELMLKSDNFKIDITDLGEEGIDLGKLYDYDIILLDIDLPDMSGYEVLKNLRTQKIDTPKELKLRGMPNTDEDLSTRVTNLYRYFDEEQFLNDINSRIDNMNLNDEFESSLEDNDGKKVRFILVENFNTNGNDCKKVKFNEPLKLSSNDQGTDVSLDICKINYIFENCDEFIRIFNLKSTSTLTPSSLPSPSPLLTPKTDTDYIVELYNSRFFSDLEKLLDYYTSFKNEWIKQKNHIKLHKNTLIT